MEVISASRESLATQVHRVLHESIIIGELAPGSLHSVTKLAERLEVSRSPVREALITLADQGMVSFERNRGVRVHQTTAHDLEEIFSMRLLLEVPATFRAAQIMRPADVERLSQSLGRVEDFVSAPTVRAHQELDAAFHHVILEAAGNQRLTYAVDTLWSHQKMSGASTAGHSRDLAEIHRDHTAVYERIAAGDPKGAAGAMRRHLVTTGSLLLAQETGGPVDTLAAGLQWLDMYADLDGGAGLS